MICELAIPHGQQLRTNLNNLRYVIKCPHCGNNIHKTKYSRDTCIYCYGFISNRINHLPGFLPARCRYYNSNYKCFILEKNDVEE